MWVSLLSLASFLAIRRALARPLTSSTMRPNEMTWNHPAKLGFFLIVIIIWLSQILGGLSTLFLPRSGALCLPNKQIPCLASLWVYASIDCDHLPTLPDPLVIAVVKPTIVTPNGLKNILAVLLYPEYLPTSTIPHIEYICVASPECVPLGLVTLATPCVILVLYDIGLARGGTPTAVSWILLFHRHIIIQ